MRLKLLKAYLMLMLLTIITVIIAAILCLLEDTESVRLILENIMCVCAFTIAIPTVISVIWFAIYEIKDGLFDE